MPKGFDDFKYNLVAACEITNFMSAIPIKLRIGQVIPEMFIHRNICISGPHELHIIDEDFVFTG